MIIKMMYLSIWEYIYSFLSTFVFPMNRQFMLVVSNRKSDPKRMVLFIPPSVSKKCDSWYP